MVANMSDEDIWNLNRGGHDARKVFAAYAKAMATKGRPTVILAKTVKGFGLGKAAEGQMVAHQQKKLDDEALKVTLALVATSSVALASGKQDALIDLLCDWGADPGTAIHAAILHAGAAAANTLIRRGAKIDLPVAALMDAETFRRMLPAANPEARHLAMAVAAQYSRVEIVRILLDAGEDPNRFNPVGGHSHCTPLHQAAAYGTMELVQLLLEYGARPDIKDCLWRGTPAGWANHIGRTEMEAYLRPLEEAAAKPA